jgi:hypothetical protein
MAGVEDDSRSELGGLFETAAPESSRGPRGGSPASSDKKGGGGTPVHGVLRAAPAQARMVGKGPIPVDLRKFKYDRTRGSMLPALAFSATKADRLDAAEAGAILDRVHEMYGIQNESEDILVAFDKALFFEHTVNGASLLQPGRGKLFVGESEFELQLVKALLGENQRRFFRAFADDIADVNREVMATYDAYDAVAQEKYGQLMQVAVERGLQKYPHLAHDSSDAGVRLSIEERKAIASSKRLVLESVVNRADEHAERVAQAA